VTGPEHYAHAEQLLDWASESEHGSGPERYNLDAAQVHATLALAAATALGSRERDGDHDGHGMDPLDRHQWERAAGILHGPPEPAEYDPGPEVDDEGGMSEYRYELPEDYQRCQS